MWLPYILHYRPHDKPRPSPPLYISNLCVSIDVVQRSEEIINLCYMSSWRGRKPGTSVENQWTYKLTYFNVFNLLEKAPFSRSNVTANTFIHDIVPFARVIAPK